MLLLILPLCVLIAAFLLIRSTILHDMRETGKYCKYKVGTYIKVTSGFYEGCVGYIGYMGYTYGEYGITGTKHGLIIYANEKDIKSLNT